MIDINAALGMVERPLHGPSREWLLKMADAEDRCGGVTVIGPGIRSVMESNECDKCGIGSRLPSGVCDHCNQPVVDPPRDEGAELREQLAEVTRERDELKLQVENDRVVMAEMNRQSDQWSKRYRDVRGERDEAIATVHGVCSERNKLSEQLATVQAELKQQREENHKVWNNLNLPCIVDPIAKDPNGIDCTLNRSYQAYLLLRGLPQVQAEAAAMRKLLSKWQAEIDTCSCTLIERQQFRDSVCQVMQGIAGRELLDELRRNGERIADLSTQLGESRKLTACYGEMINRLERKTETAKLAYIETLRGKIDDSWFGEQSPVWQYRNSEREAGKTFWRTSDGVHVEYYNRNGWVKSRNYHTWQACCDDPETYPCDESGKRIEEQMNVEKIEHVECNCGGTIMSMGLKIEDQTKRIADLERQLVERNQTIEACRKAMVTIGECRDKYEKQSREATDEFIKSAIRMSYGSFADSFNLIQAALSDGGAK